MEVNVNYLAVIVAAIIYYAGGAIWYSPMLFAKPWMAAVGLTEEKIKEGQKGAWKSYMTALVAALIISYGMARLVGYMNLETFMGGLQLGFWCWLCFVITTASTNNAFSGRPVKLLLIDSGYHLYGFLVIGVILVVWK
jgi:hypothetical protein